MAAQPLLGLNNVPSPTKSDTPGGGSNFGRPAGNPLGQQSFWEQMSVFPDGTPRPNTVYGNSVGAGQSGGGQSSGQGGSNQGWQPQPVGSNTGMDFGGLLQSMLGGVNNNISSAGFGGGQQGGGWQHNYQPAYFPYANNSGLGFGGGTAGMFLRPQQYIPGTQTTWAGDLPQYQAETSAAFDRDHLAQIRMDQEIARANGKAKVEGKRADQAAYQTAIGRQPDDWKNIPGTYKQRRDAILAENERRRKERSGPSTYAIQ